MLESLLSQGINIIQHQVIYSAILFLLLFPAIRYFRKTSPLLAMGLCWLVLIRLVLPVDISSPFSLRAVFDLFSFESHQQQNASGLVGPAQAYSPLHAAHNHETEFPLWQCALLMLWFSGTVFFFVKFCRQRSRFARIMRNARAVGDFSLGRMVIVWKARFGVRRKVSLVMSDRCGSIFTTGIIHPNIFIPVSLLRNAGPRDIEIVIAHEMAHIKRLDDALIVVLAVIRCLYFFNPVVWYCIRQIQDCREKACDRDVLSKKVFTAHDYCQSLLNIVTGSRAHGGAGSVATFGRNQGAVIKDRISYLNEDSAMKYISKRSATIFMGCLGLILLPMAPAHSNRPGADAVVFASPVKDGWISSAYGMRVWPAGENKGKNIFHRGIDIAGKAGTQIYSIADGVVDEVINDYENSANPKYGKYIVINHPNGIQSRYLHLQDASVSAGQAVKAGQSIGSMGSTGEVTGAHLHFELYENGKHINPGEHIVIDLPLGKPVAFK